MSESRQHRLGDLANLTLGYAFPSAQFADRAVGPRLLRGENIGFGETRWGTTKWWPAELADGFEDLTLRAGDVVLAMDRPWLAAGLKHAFIRAEDTPALLVQRVTRLRAGAHMDQRYLRYLIRSQHFAAYVLSVQTGSTIPHISGSQIADYQLPRLPSIEEQRFIANVLSCLDNKTDSNQRVAALSIELADLLFEQQFADLPLDLELGQLADVIDCLHSRKPDRTAAGGLLLQLDNIGKDGLLRLDDVYLISRDDYVRWSARIELSEGDSIITNVGRIAATARIPAGVKAALGRNMTGIRPTGSDGAFIASALRSPRVRAGLETLVDSGTIMDSLNVRSIPSIRLPGASPEHRSEFENAARPLFSRADQAINESRALGSLRDVLLEGLLSGTLAVPDVKERMRAVV